MTQKLNKLGLPPTITDERVCEILLSKASLTDDQMAAVVEGAAKVAAGGQLGKNTRDRFMAIVLAQGLAKKSEIKPRRVGNGNGPVVNPGDCFSTSVTTGTRIAESILDVNWLPKEPPGKRRTG